MKKRMISILMAVVLMATLAAGCGSKVKEPEKPQEQGTVANSGEDRQETPEVTEEAASSVLKDGNMVELLVLLPGPTSHPADQEAVEDSNVKNEITAIGNVLAKYEAVIGCGLAEPEETVAKLLKELEAAGIQNVIDDVQRQVDAWESTK